MNGRLMCLFLGMCFLCFVGFEHSEKSIVRDACWTLSNIIPTDKVIQLVIDTDILPALIALQSTADASIRNEAVYAVLDATL